MTTLFTIPISSTRGSILCSNPAKAKGLDVDTEKVYILTFSSPPDNRLTPTFISAFLLALDIIEHRYPRGVVVSTSAIAKFYSNGLDLQLAQETEGFMEKYLWVLFRRLITYPMPTISLLNGHAFAGGLMFAMYHDYRIMNPVKGFLCLNEIDFGVPLQTPMMSIFREKLTPATFRDLVLEARRVPGPEALARGVVDGLGGLEEVVGFIAERKLEGKARSGIYGVMKEEMYRGILGGLEDHEGNLGWRDRIEERKQVLEGESERRVEAWEREKAKL
ncbi:enoyl-CoA hydratase/isomerase family protein [Aspergillus lucknowensis]|uniref:ClpP/crotonase-like domain-containing protein n=1 Tax=Aspergillus lucknowensis TaxID=176173 RepID=A0ABR4L8U0_9EURO